MLVDGVRYEPVTLDGGSVFEIPVAGFDWDLPVTADTVAMRFGEPAEIFREDVIRELYDIDAGSYDVVFGSVELPRVEGKPEVFVLSGCGSGIPVFRQLQKDGVPFAAGILYENDVDYRIARCLAAEVVTEKPFCPISDESLARARQLMITLVAASMILLIMGKITRNATPCTPERSGASV